jgi:hypothetical protein
MTTTVSVPDKGTNAAKTRGNAHAEPMKIEKRIGSTVFTVNVRFNAVSTEKPEDIIFRLIEREVA